MSTARNIGRGVSATSAARAALIAAVACLLPAAVAAGSPPDQLPRPDAGDVVTAYRTLRDWVDLFEAPSIDTDEARVPLAGASGVCVLLRRSGRLMGTGADTAMDDLALRRAAGRALSDLLGDPAVESLPDSMLGTIGPTLAVELEVGGAPVPVLGQTFAEVARHLEPGLDGVALRRGADWAMLFPAQLRATNSAAAAERMLPGLASQLGLAPMGLAELRQGHDVSVYRFRTIHLAQARPDRAPFETARGRTLVSSDEVTRESIAAAADGIASYLMQLRWRKPEPVGVMGTYQPVADRYEPLLAPPIDQALVALALARYARAPGLPEPRRQLVADAGHEVFHELRRLAPGELDPLDSTVACAAIVLAGHELGELDADCRSLFTMASGRVLNSLGPEGSFVEVDPEGGPATAIGPHGSAMIAAALARQLRSGGGGVDAELARRAIDAAWASAPPHRHVSLLPWIGWAEIDYAEATASEPSGVDQLDRIRDLLERSRIGAGNPAAPQDLWGAFALESGAARPIGDAQTLRPAAWLALAIRDPRLTDPDAAGLWLVRHLETMRFLMQLTVRDSDLWAYRNAGRAAGGVRSAPWNDDMPVAAQVMGLLTAAETLSSLETLAARVRGTP